MTEMLAIEFLPFHAGFFFVLGLLFGSFFNVCVYRMPTGQNISVPGSYCYSCGTFIKWYDNIPVLAYLALGGRCRECKSPFSSRYALIELLTGCLFLVVFLRFGFTWAMPAYLVFTGLLLICTFTDLDHWIILDRVSLGGAAAGVVFALVLGAFAPRGGDAIVAHTGPVFPDAEGGVVWWGPVVNAVVGALAGAVLLYGVGVIGRVVFRKPAMGLGDVKLMLLVGAFGGWAVGLLTIFVASVFGAVFGVGALMLTGRGEEKVVQEDGIEGDEAVEGPDLEGFEGAEREALERVLAEPVAPRGGGRHHLPFGPHLALAAFLLVLYEPEVMEAVRAYFSIYDMLMVP